MIAVYKQINSHEMTELQTECKLLWTQLIIGNSYKLFVGAYYRPHIGDQCSIDELNLSLQRLDEAMKNAEIWLIGDFNAPCINREFMSLSTKRTHVAQYSSLIDVIQEHGLEQIVNHQRNILDFFFLNYPSTKYTIDILPGLADHDIFCVDMRSEISKQNPREIYLYHRANWDS